MDSRGGGEPAGAAARVVSPGDMRDGRVSVLAAIGFLSILGGLLVLALPSPYEGAALYILDSNHSFSQMDLLGLALVALGAGAAWDAGAVWQRGIRGAQGPAGRMEHRPEMGR